MNTEHSINGFKSQMAEHNLDPGEIIADSTIHRFPTWGDKTGETSGAYWHNGQFGWFQDWRTMDRPKVVSGKLSKADQEALNGSFTGINNKVSRKALEAGIRNIWNAGTEPVGHPYMKKKGITIPPGLIKQHDRCLIVPVFGINGELNGIQRIDANGRKRFLAGTRKKGSFFSIPGNGLYIVCEGFATGATLHMATGASIVVSFDAGNLFEVATAISKRVNKENIIIAGDDDSGKPGQRNIGADCAKKAGQAIGAVVLFPNFKDPDGENTTDFNDLQRLEGLDNVRKQIQEAERRPDPQKDVKDYHPTDMGNAERLDDPPRCYNIERESSDFLKEANQDDKPEINAKNRNLPEISDQALKALQKKNSIDPYLFTTTSGEIIRVESNPSGKPLTQSLNQDGICYELARCANWYCFNKKKEQISDLPPPYVCKDILANPSPGLPLLDRIVEFPFFDINGTLHVKKGYSHTSRSYLSLPKGFKMPEVPEFPNLNEIKKAKDLFEELVKDFPFISEAEKANACSLFLLPYIRENILGPTPNHSIESNAPGTGKTKLGRVLIFPALGRCIETLTEEINENDWTKKITSKLSQFPSFFFIDNVRHPLKSSSLSSVITSLFWEDRILGQSKIISLPVKCVWITTGNNTRFSSEMLRRTVRIRMDAGMDRPWTRGSEVFTHPDLELWVQQNRGKLLWAALVMIRAWIAEGRPYSSAPVLGMFEDYSRVMGGILNVNKIDKFLSNLDDFYEDSDEESENTKALIDVWWNNFKTKVVGVSELFKLIQTSNVTLNLGDASEQSQKIKLGIFLSRIRDRVFDHLKVVKVRDKQRAQQWTLQPLNLKDLSNDSQTLTEHSQAR